MSTQRKVVVVGAGMGGLTAALRLAQKGYEVTVIEARSDAGGLASGFSAGGHSFDAGPYILLDRPGLEWAFQAVGLQLENVLKLKRITHVYDVSFGSGAKTVRFYSDLERTAASFEQLWSGSGKRYVEFVKSMTEIHQRLSAMQFVSNPGVSSLLRTQGWKSAPFLLKPLQSILARTGLPPELCEAISIWTHVAGQSVAEAPSPLALVPALIHGAGAWYPEGGIRAIPLALTAAAKACGVQFRFNQKVHSLTRKHDKICGMDANGTALFEADAVVSNYSGIGTYLELVNHIPNRARTHLKSLPLQSPGVCAYLAARVSRPGAEQPYLRFFLPGNGELCRLLIAPHAIAPESTRDGEAPLRLLSPMRHSEAEKLGAAGQREYLEKILAESWWRGDIHELRVLTTRIPEEWGSAFNLYRQSMNPVMTARFMRAGRLAHRSPYMKGLYLAGSSTHPGQWVSFCAISGVLAADSLREDCE